MPRLVADGFTGPIYCTAASADIVKIVLLDAAYIMEEDAIHKRHRHDRAKHKGSHQIRPLYTQKDVEKVLPLLRAVDFGKSFDVTDRISGSFHEAGHILGSATVRIESNETGPVVFSGDIGRWDKPILRDPDPFDSAETLLIESTYGDRRHEDPGDLLELLGQLVETARSLGGKVIIPSFAIGRTQELLYRLHELFGQKRIAPIATYLDSPMAIRVTDVFKAHAELYDEEMRSLVEERNSPFSMSNLIYSQSSDQSKAINDLRGSAIVIAGSGMCTGGRVKHHLVHNLSKPEGVILFVGYQAEGTLGREISSGKKRARVFGVEREVRARVIQIHGFSAHADREELLRWLKGVTRPPRRAFVTHGESEVAVGFAETIHTRTGIPASAPRYQERVDI